jgi:hypothetical protein
MGLDIEETFNHVMAVIDGFPEQIQVPVREMMDGPVGEQFFTAPASSYKDFHSCYPGGLAEHSLGVVSVAREMARVVCPDMYPRWKIDFCALFHDLGKVGDGEHPFYVQTREEWRLRKGQLYVVHPDCLDMPTAERGIFILNSHGVPMDADMTLGIRISDGQYVAENAPFKLHEPFIALVTHWADYTRTMRERDAARE